jgi:tRNA-specific 2-thiouridylase
MDFNEIRDKRVALLLSGGVDSSVALAILSAHGVRPDCFYIKIGPDEERDEWNCTSEEDIELATALAHRYQCRLEVVDCHREYFQQVTKYTMEHVLRGLTPNPDVMCNRLIKFGAFDQKRGHDYQFIATGHYAQTEAEGGWRWLVTSPDPVKDQTDFLCQLYPWQLQKALFPIGHMMKEEVRRIAEEEHLLNARRKDSQGICFLGKIDYTEYVRRYLGEQPGDVIEKDTGRLIGRHRGHWFYTIGQRKGLGFGGGPWFIVNKDTERNVLYVAHGYAPEQVYSSEFCFHGFHSLMPKGYPLPQHITFKIRHTATWQSATLHSSDGDVFTVRTEQPVHGVAPGQFCVVYDAEHHRCLGSGELVTRV